MIFSVNSLIWFPMMSMRMNKARRDPEIKRKIREAAEDEEREFYSGKAPQEWIDALAPLGTDEHKPHLTDAPWWSCCSVKRTG